MAPATTLATKLSLLLSLVHPIIAHSPDYAGDDDVLRPVWQSGSLCMPQYTATVTATATVFADRSVWPSAVYNHGGGPIGWHGANDDEDSTTAKGWTDGKDSDPGKGGNSVGGENSGSGPYAIGGGSAGKGTGSGPARGQQGYDGVVGAGDGDAQDQGGQGYGPKPDQYGPGIHPPAMVSPSAPARGPYDSKPSMGADRGYNGYGSGSGGGKGNEGGKLPTLSKLIKYARRAH